MRWRQFLTPVTSMSADETRELLTKQPETLLLDVRQPGEYEAEHIAGALLIPLGDLSDRLKELDPQKPMVVYCASGGRSRVAAQMLSGKDFTDVINMSGGIKAWNGWTGFGEYEQGLELFSGTESVQDVLAVAYVMEHALGEFYSSMAESVKNTEAATLFRKLAAFEDKHRVAVAERYETVAGEMPPVPETGALPEGGVSTEEYMRRLGTDMESPQDIVAFAMSMEAQAMDLYTRAARNAPDDTARKALERIALEERGHLKHLAVIMDRLV